MRKLTALMVACFAVGVTCAQQPVAAVAEIPPGGLSPCKSCDAPNTQISSQGNASINFNSNNTFSLSQPISISTSPAKGIVSIAAFLSYFEFVPGSPDCFTCNKSSATYGNMVNGQIGANTATGGGTHELSVSYSSLQPSGNYPLQCTVSLPPLVACCEGTIRWCIRITVTFEDCTVCHKVLCYERRKSFSNNPVLNKQN
jgi:hypothetical protein